MIAQTLGEETKQEEALVVKMSPLVVVKTILSQKEEEELVYIRCEGKGESESKKEVLRGIHGS